MMIFFSLNFQPHNPNLDGSFRGLFWSGGGGGGEVKLPPLPV